MAESSCQRRVWAAVSDGLLPDRSTALVLLRCQHLKEHHGLHVLTLTSNYYPLL